MPRPAYRMRIFEPRSLGEDQLLTPALGAPHPLPAAFATTTLRPNQLPNPEAAVDLTGWFGFNSATVTRDTGTLLFGPASVKVVTPVSDGGLTPGVVFQLGSGSTSGRIPVVVGDTYAASVHLEGTGAVGKLLRIRLQFYDAAGTSISTVDQNFTVVAGWTRVSVVGVAPAGAVSCRCRVDNSSLGQGTFTYYLCGAMLEGLDRAPSLVDNPSVGVNLNGWSAFNGSTVTRITATFLSGGPATSAQVVTPVSDGGATSGIDITRADGTRFPVTPGRLHGAGAWFEGTGAVSKGIRIRVVWLDITGSNAPFVADNLSTTISLAAGWTYVECAGVAPLGAVTAQIRISTIPVGQGTFTFLVSQAGFAETEPWIQEWSGRAGPYNASAVAYLPLMGVPSGRRATLDPLTVQVNPGSQTVRLLNQKTVPGGAEETGYITAYLGDSLGVPQTAGLRVEMDFTEDLTPDVGGVLWERHSTGRIDGEGTSGLVSVQLTVADMVAEFDDKIFWGTPHSAVAYALPPVLWPYGLAGPYGTFPIAPKMKGTIATAITGGGKMVQLDQPSVSDLRNILPQEVGDAGIPFGTSNTGVPLGSIRYSSDLQLWVKQTSGGGAGTVAQYLIGGITTQDYFHPKGGVLRGDELSGGYEIHDIYLKALPGGTAVPANGVTVEVSLRKPNLPPSESSPLILVDVHPATLLKDAADGKFGRLDDAGAVTVTYPRTTSFETLEADPTYFPLRLIITDRKALSELFTEVCVQSGFGWRVNEFGQLDVYDLRPPTTLVGIPAFDDGDLVGKPDWAHSRQDTIRWVDVECYADWLIGPQELTITDGFRQADSTALIRSNAFTLEPHAFGGIDLGNSTHTIKATGYRRGARETAANMDRELVLEGRVLKLVDDLKSAYAYGPQRITVALARTAAAKALREGSLMVYDFATLPNPGTNTLGGSRVGRVLEWNDVDDQRRLRVLDLGPNVTLSSPVLGALAALTGNTANGITAPVTVDAAGDPVTLEVAAMTSAISLGSAVPEEMWVRAKRVTSSQTVEVTGLPSGRRIFVRIRSEVGPTSVAKIPSAWTYSTGTDYVDLTALATPTALATNDLTQLSSRLTWSVGGNTSAYVKLYLASPSSDPVSYVRLLPPGTEEFTVDGLVSGDTYKAAVSLFDGGGESALSGTVTWTAAGTPGQCPKPLALLVRGNPT